MLTALPSHVAMFISNLTAYLSLLYNISIFVNTALLLCILVGAIESKRVFDNGIYDEQTREHLSRQV